VRTRNKHIDKTNLHRTTPFVLYLSQQLVGKALPSLN
jgi:hypothetical protein